MSDQGATNSDLVEIVKRNGDFRKNYGLIIGAILYLRSISAAHGRPSWWKGLIVAVAAAIALLLRHGFPPFISGSPN